jgi:LysM repeat protein
VGDVSNNGTSDVDYVVSITDNTAKPVGTGFFTNGATHGTAYADFDAAYDPVNGLSTQLTAQRYTVQAGDTLESIAQQIWGDANFWYLIADANGIASDDQLIAGQDIVIPDKVANNQNNANTFRVYDPNLAMGNTSPTHPPKPHSNSGCGVVGQIIETVVSVAVSYMFGPIAGDVAEQLTAMALGDQKNFNWKALGVDVATDALVGVGGSGDPLIDAAHAVAANVVRQGLNLALGLQKKFDWTGVAVAGVVGGVTSWAGNELQANNVTFGLTDANAIGAARGFTASMAGAIAGAASRSLIKGTDFGDNLVSELPDVIGATVGNLFIGGVNNVYAQQQGGASLASNDPFTTSGDLSQLDTTLPQINPDGTVVDTPSMAATSGIGGTGTGIMPASGVEEVW